MADTIAELSDLFAQQQREINDIEVLLSSQGQTIDQNAADIVALQNPASGVPAELLEWLDTHSIREVDTTLDTDLTTLSSSVIDNTSDIVQLQSDLNTEVADRIAGDDTLTDITTDLQSQVTANLVTLTQEIADRSTLSVTVAEGLGTVNDRIDDLQADLTTSSEAGSTASSSLSSQIASMSASLQTAQTQIALLQGTGVDPAGAQAAQIVALTAIANDAAADVAQEITDRTNADATLQASITTLNASVSGLGTSISDEANTREAADLDIQSDVAALTAEIAGHAGLISAEESARIAADLVFTNDISSLTTDLTDAQNDIVDETTNRENADTSLQALIDTNTSDIDANTAAISLAVTDIGDIQDKFSVVKDGGGYVTGWRDIAEDAAAGNFRLKNLNNNVRLEAVGYEGKFFPAVTTLAYSAASASLNYGTADDAYFHGTDTNDYTRKVEMITSNTVGIGGATFRGVDFSTGGNFNRLGQTATTFMVSFSGGVNKSLSLWYRLKASTGDTADRWYPVAMTQVTLPNARDYEYVSGRAVVQITTDAGKVIQFGLTVLDTADATIDDDTKDFVYDPSFSVTALNMATVS